jgi:hypothetical protein
MCRPTWATGTQQSISAYREMSKRTYRIDARVSWLPVLSEELGCMRLFRSMIRKSSARCLLERLGPTAGHEQWGQD